jgi:glucose-6-phosphate isomerase
MTKSSDRFDLYCRRRCALDDPFVELDLSHAMLADADLQRLDAPLQQALAAMARLEGGAIANADEQRMVGHYWLRAPGLAPDDAISEEIAATVQRIEEFAAQVRGGQSGNEFGRVVVCGIGGSALGPLWLADAFAGRDPKAPALTVLDNTDPDGIDREIARLGSLQDVLVVVVSKSGGTPETRNGMRELQRAFARQRHPFAAHAVAITMPGSALDQLAQQEKWRLRLPMWDWVGGRTSITSAVGLLPAALIGMDLRAFLAGAAAMDAATRRTRIADNPAAMLAAFWHVQGNGRGERAMVVLPYKDRLLLLSRYLQQLVMESLGKEHDRKGKVVHQGLAVYGNKGSTDQHAYVQQLRDGRHDFFATFVRVLRDRDEDPAARFEVEPGVTTGDYLDGFWQGTRQALFEKGRASATLVLDHLDERALGALVALFERTVGLYGELIDVNAYHQPGVEAGKQAAARVLERQRQLLAALGKEPRDVQAIAAAVGGDAADCWPILCHLAANGRARRLGPPDPRQARFCRA